MRIEELDRAEAIRSEILIALRRYRPSEHVHCPSCDREKVKELEQDREYNVLAYQQMTPEQIPMSEERLYQIQHKEIWDYMERVRKAEEQAKKSKLIVS